MMNKLLFYCFICGGMIFLFSCQSNSTQPTERVVISNPTLASASLLLQKGEYLEAASQYGYVREHAISPEERAKASLGAAKSFVKVNQYNAAMAVLSPLPESPENSVDRQRVAYLGEILLRKNNPKDAESCLEVALSGVDTENSTEKWISATLANLGSAYAKNKKRDLAASCLAAAAKRFTKEKDISSAQRCRDAADAIVK